MDNITFELVDPRTGLTVNVVITDNGDGTLNFDVNVDESTGVIGDLNGLFFDIQGDSIPSGLTITGDDVTETAIKEESITKVDSYNTLNGEVVKETGKFDVGVQFGTQGISTDDIQSTSFTLSADEPLSLDMFDLEDFGVRLTSVGDIDGSREDSLKIGGESGDITSEVEHIANNDTMTVSSDETFDETGFFTDLLDTDGQLGVLSVLENDTTDGAAYTGDVVGVNDMDLVEDFQFVGSDGGLLIMNADGTLDFSANGEFEDLAVGETRTTDFSYQINGGATGTITVTVFGADDDTGGGGGGIDGGTGGTGDGTDGIDPDLLPGDDPFML